MHASNPAVGLTCVVGLILAAAGPVVAHDQGTKGDRASSQRVVMQCGTDAMTRRAFTREHGAQPVFVTAREVQAARASGQAWTAPRCMTVREHARLVQTMSANASVR